MQNVGKDKLVKLGALTPHFGRTLMQTKLTLPVVLLSIVMACAFAMQWIREQNQVYSLTIGEHPLCIQHLAAKTVATGAAEKPRRYVQPGNPWLDR